MEKISPAMAAPEAVVILGLRRVGKTTLIRHIFDSLPTSNKLFFDLENPLNRKRFESDNFDGIWADLQILGLKADSRAYIFLDEIQFLTQAPSIVKYLADHFAIKFVLTGSSSFYLKNRFSESLSGRKTIFELFPLSFSEILAYKQPEILLEPLRHATVSESIYKTLMPLYEEYLQYGGFPAVVLKSSADEKRNMLEDIFTSYFNLEVLQLSDFRKTHLIRDLILLLLNRSGSLIDVSRLSRELGISRSTVSEYLGFLEGTYFFHFVPPLSKSLDVRVRRAKKCYPCDMGFLTCFGTPSPGAVFETALYHQLRCRGQITYAQKASGKEIDFVLDGVHGFESKLLPTSSDFRTYDTFSKSLGLVDFTLISKRFCDLPGVKYGFQI